jgi:RNA polymerase sigma-70 factor (ECF subfamily)
VGPPLPRREVRDDRAAPDPGVRPGLSARHGSSAADAVATTFRAEFGRAVAILARGLGGDVDRAEEAVQDAYAVALDRWPRDGVPSSPAAWILTTAKRRAIDRLRREAALREKQALLARELEEAVRDLPSEDAAMIPDERLGLVFACCHPALALEAQVPLTLRLVGGLTVPEISRALLLPEATVAQRLVRAKKKVRLSGIPIAEPPPDALEDRLAAVLSVLYLVFNEGYAATGGDALVREDVAAEAIRLARVVHTLLPDEPEPAGLLALMLLHHARRAARVASDGDLVLLEAQDRSLWDRAMIGQALPLVDRALTLRRPPGPYALQAAIAAVHAQAPRAEATDWCQIALLYDELGRVLPTPVVTLNRAVAVAMSEGPGAGLALVDALAAGGALDDYHLLHAARADLLRREGRTAEAAAAYARALELATNAAERRFLAARLEECRPG